MLDGTWLEPFRIAEHDSETPVDGALTSRIKSILMRPSEFKALRMAVQVTQRQLAEFLGKSRVTISRYENGVLRIPRSIAHSMRSPDLREFARRLRTGLFLLKY